MSDNLFDISKNLNRDKSRTPFQPVVGRVSKVPKYGRIFLWKNAPKRDVKREAKNSFLEPQSNKKPTGVHKRAKNSSLLTFTDEDKDADADDEDEDSEDDVDSVNDVEMEDNIKEDWEKEDAEKLRREIKSHTKKAKRRISENSAILSTESSEQVDTEMDQIFNFFPQQCQLETNNNTPTDPSSNGIVSLK